MNSRHRRLSILVGRSTVPIYHRGSRGYSSVIRRPHTVPIVVMMVLLLGDSTGTDSTELSIVHSLVLLLPLPWLSLAGAGGIIVRGAWTVAFLSFVCTAEKDLEGCRDKEEDTGFEVSVYSLMDFRDCSLRCDDRSDESHPLQLAREMIVRPNGRVIDTGAFVSTSPSQNGDGDEGSAKQDVKEDSEEGEECDSSEEACENYSECGINDGSAGHALNCLLPCRDRLMA